MSKPGYNQMFIINSDPKKHGQYPSASKDKSSLAHKKAMDLHEEKMERLRLEAEFNEDFDYGDN